jgi:hypothetical protein
MGWTLFTALGLGIGSTLGMFVSWELDDAAEAALGTTAAWVVFAIFFGGLTALGLSLGQLTVVQENPWRWALYSVVGGVVGLLLIMPLIADNSRLPEPVQPLIGGLVMGAAIGLAQWLLLRRTITNAAIWIFFTAVAIALAMSVSFALGDEGRELVAFTVGPLVGALTTAAGWAWIHRTKSTKA